MRTFKLGLYALLASFYAASCTSDGSDRQGEAEGSEQEARPFVTPEQLSGDYLLVVSTTIAPRIPVIYQAQLEAEQDGERLVLHLRERPLSKLDRRTPVGPWTEWVDATVDSEGHLDTPSLHLTIPADANAVTGLDTEVEISLTGWLPELTGGAVTDFLCGEVTGRIVGPIALDDLSGSTFTVTRVADLDDPDSYPEPAINCDHEPARPL